MAGRTKREVRDQDVQGLKCLRKIGPLFSRHTPFEVLSGKAVRIDATAASPKGDADGRAVLQRTIEADRCYILDRGYISYRLWNAINAVGSSYYPEHDVVDGGFRLTERHHGPTEARGAGFPAGRVARRIMSPT